MPTPRLVSNVFLETSMPSTASVILRLSLQILLSSFTKRLVNLAPSSTQRRLRIDQPCTQDLRQNASQDTVQPKQRSLEKRGRIYRSGLVAKGTPQAHRFPRHPAEIIICRTAGVESLGVLRIGRSAVLRNISTNMSKTGSATSHGRSWGATRPIRSMPCISANTLNCSSPWIPPSPAMRRLCELQTIRAGTVAGLTEWKNRRGSGMTDDLALSLAATTIQHFTAQLEAVDQAIAETIDNDVELSAKRDLLVSINGVGKALAGIVLAELPGPDILGSSAEDLRPSPSTRSPPKTR